MTILALTDDGDYHVVHPDQDCRGWLAVDAAGQPLGRVKDLMIDTEHDRVDSLRLDDGSNVAVEKVRLGTGVVHVGEARGVAALTEAADARVTRDIVALPRVVRRSPRDAAAVVATPGAADHQGPRTMLRGS